MYSNSINLHKLVTFSVQHINSFKDTNNNETNKCFHELKTKKLSHFAEKKTVKPKKYFLMIQQTIGFTFHCLHWVISIVFLNVCKLFLAGIFDLAISKT